GVWRDRAEAQLPIQRHGFRHQRLDRIETHGGVTNLPRGGDRRTGQLPAKAVPAHRRPHIQPLHLADLWAKPSQGHTAGILLASPREEQSSVRTSVLSWKALQLFVEVLKTQAEAE